MDTKASTRSAGYQSKTVLIFDDPLCSPRLSANSHAYKIRVRWKLWQHQTFVIPFTDLTSTPTMKAGNGVLRLFSTQDVALSCEPKSKKRALLVGIAYQGTSGVLKGPHKDVEDVKALIIEKYGYRPDDIVTLVDDNDSEKSHLQPTKENLMREMEKLLENAKKGDRFLFHYSGHGFQGEVDQHSPEEDKKEEYIVPCDAEEGEDGFDPKDCIQDDTLKDLLVTRLPMGAHLVAVFDTCHSQSLLDLKHHRCNRSYVPWSSKGKRNSRAKRVYNQRRLAMIQDLPDPIRTRSVYRITGLRNGRAKSTKSVDEFHIKTNANAPTIPPSQSGPSIYGVLSPSALQNLPSRTTGHSFHVVPNPLKKLKQRVSRATFGERKEPLVLNTWLPTIMRQPSSSSTLVGGTSEPFLLDNGLVDSPIAEFCSGLCRDSEEEGSEEEGGAFSLSSCSDDQVTWENPEGNSMTQGVTKGHPSLLEQTRKQGCA